jgi:hypothetical protein
MTTPYANPFWCSQASIPGDFAKLHKVNQAIQWLHTHKYGYVNHVTLGRPITLLYGPLYKWGYLSASDYVGQHLLHLSIGK